jgi:hypothetical protein
VSSVSMNILENSGRFVKFQEYLGCFRILNDFLRNSKKFSYSLGGSRILYYSLGIYKIALTHWHIFGGHSLY